MKRGQNNKLGTLSIEVKYPREKWDNKALGTVKDGYTLTSVKEVGETIIELWQKS